MLKWRSLNHFTTENPKSLQLPSLSEITVAQAVVAHAGTTDPSSAEAAVKYSSTQLETGTGLCSNEAPGLSHSSKSFPTIEIAKTWNKAI